MCKTVTRMANDVNAWDTHDEYMRDDCLIHNTHRALRAWQVTF